jgi:protein TonB
VLVALLTTWVLWEDEPQPRAVPRFEVALPASADADADPVPEPQVVPPEEMEPQVVPVEVMDAQPRSEPESLPQPLEDRMERPWLPRHLRFRPEEMVKPPQPEVETPAMETPAAGPPGPAPSAQPVVIAPSVDRTKAPQPQYPRRAQRLGWHGVTMLLVDVDAQGDPSQVSLEASSGYDILDEAAVAAVRTWRFHPATRDGVAEAGQLRVAIRFAGRRDYE